MMNKISPTGTYTEREREERSLSGVELPTQIVEVLQPLTFYLAEMMGQLINFFILNNMTYHLIFESH